jgi:hypothetical protein
MNTHHDTASPTVAPGIVDRRRVLAAVLAGGALTLPVARSVSADDNTTTTAPPRRDDADTAVLTGALDLERDLVATYFALYTRGGLSAEESAVVLAVHDNHKAYVDVLVGHLGPDAPPDDGRTASAPSGSFEAVCATLATAEARAVVTHLASIASLRGVEAAALLASVVTVEARHQTVMAILGGQSASSATA